MRRDFVMTAPYDGCFVVPQVSGSERNGRFINAYHIFVVGVLSCSPTTLVWITSTNVLPNYAAFNCHAKANLSPFGDAYNY